MKKLKRIGRITALVSAYAFTGWWVYEAIMMWLVDFGIANEHYSLIYKLMDYVID